MVNVYCAIHAPQYQARDIYVYNTNYLSLIGGKYRDNVHNGLNDVYTLTCVFIETTIINLSFLV